MPTHILLAYDAYIVFYDTDLALGLGLGGISLGTRRSKNRKGGSGKSAGVEVYTAPGMQAHFRLAFD